MIIPLKRKIVFCLRPPEFTPHMAWQMLNCRYLRLTKNNIKMLEEICGDAGYDIVAHPHVQEHAEVDLAVSHLNTL